MFLVENLSESVLQSFVMEAHKFEKVRQRVVARVLESGLLERKIFQIPQITPKDICVAGVDGGLASFPFGCMDVALIRVAGVLFRYQEGVLSEAQYVPSELPGLGIFAISEPIDLMKLEIANGMCRQLKEVQLATQIAKTRKPHLLLLDGSVVPQYVAGDKDSLLEKLYAELLESYSLLYETCERQGVFLAGFVKNSRGQHFVHSLGHSPELSGEDREILSRFRDTDFLKYVMRLGQRTCTSLYRASSCGSLSRWRNRTHLFYLRVSEATLPFRVEFVEFGDNAELTASCIASWVFFLSSFNPAMSSPSVLLEADLRARVSEEEAEIARNKLQSLGRPQSLDVIQKFV